MLTVVRNRPRPPRRTGRGRLATVFGCAAFCVGCSGQAAPGRTDAAAPGADGAAVFAMACVRCHGPEGRGDGPLAPKVGPVPDLVDADLRLRYDRRALEDLVRAGRGNMPPHRDRLSAPEIEAVLDMLAVRFGGPR